MSVAGSYGARSDRARNRTIAVPIPSVGTSALVAGGIALVLALAAFVASGGLRLEPTTRVLVGLMLVSGGMCAAAALRAPRTPERPLYGGFALLAFTLLAVFTAVSVVWSLSPGESWVEANRTFAYLAVFAGGIALARLVPAAWEGVLAGVLAGCAVICGWALLTKVFPAALAADETFARLRAPFEYWNSVGLMAALGVLPAVWLGARRHGYAAAGALAPPVIGLLLVALMLCYSRGSLIALGAGLIVFFAAVPLRLAGLATLGLGVVGAAPVVWWAFQQDGLTTDAAPMSARVDAGHELGALLALMVIVLALAGLAFQFARSHRSPSQQARTWIVRGLVLAAVLALLGGIGAVAASEDGLGGQASQAWKQLTDPNARTPANTPDRLKATSSVRARYWDEAFRMRELSPWVGVGAGGYSIARFRYRKDVLAVRHAHGYVPQTIADLGWVGLGLSLLTVIAWWLAAARATGIRPRDRGLRFDPERIGGITLVAMAVLYGVHSALDWTWFVPANTVAGVLVAGWIAGRAPLRRRLLGGADDVVLPVAREEHWQRRSGVDAVRERTVAFVRSRPLATAAAALLALTALAAAWTAIQPVRSLHATRAAYDRLGVNAPDAAASIATIATKRDPLSVDAWFDLAAVEQARNHLAAAQAAFEHAVRLEPGNPETWRRLGRFQLGAGKDPKAAMRSLQASLILDPVSMTARSDVLQAAHALAAQEQQQREQRAAARKAKKRRHSG